MHFLRGVQVRCEYRRHPGNTGTADRLLAFPDVASLPEPPPGEGHPPVLPIHFRRGETSLRLFTTIATLGTPRDVTLRRSASSVFPDRRCDRGDLPSLGGSQLKRHARSGAGQARLCRRSLQSQPLDFCHCKAPSLPHAQQLLRPTCFCGNPPHARIKATALDGRWRGIRLTYPLHKCFHHVRTDTGEASGLAQATSRSYADAYLRQDTGPRIYKFRRRLFHHSREAQRRQ